MPKFNIKFSYYAPEMIVENLSNGKSQPKTYGWDSHRFLDWVLNIKTNIAKRPKACYSLKNANRDLGGLEWNDTYYDKGHNIYAIRLIKMKSNGIPAFKYIGEDSERIKLHKGEFLDSFNLLVFDHQNRRVAIQHNSAGLSRGQVELILTDMFNYWKHKYDKANSKISYHIKLLEVIDQNKANDPLRDTIFRHLNIKCADTDALSKIPKKYKTGLIGYSSKMAGISKGVSVNFSISMSHEAPSESLDAREMKNLVKSVKAINRGYYKKHKKNLIDLIIKSKKKVQEKLRDVDILVPKLESTIQLVSNSRSTIGFPFIYHTFLSYYLGKVRSNVYYSSTLH